MKKIVSLVVLAGFLAFSVGCGGGSSSAPAGKVPSPKDMIPTGPGAVPPGTPPVAPK